MKKKADVQLIGDTLSGDDAAFSLLVERYQKSIHALVWRKIGDFHYAEEITQDIFLKAYQKLTTLKEPYCFKGWLYRIATRQCFLSWRKKRIQTQSLETTNIKLIEKISYSQFVAKEQAEVTTQTQRDIVDNLLTRLPKSERTVVRLYYLEEMNCKEISELLRVSANTIKSRLHRARHRLRTKNNDLLI